MLPVGSTVAAMEMTWVDEKAVPTDRALVGRRVAPMVVVKDNTSADGSVEWLEMSMGWLWVDGRVTMMAVHWAVDLAARWGGRWVDVLAVRKVLCWEIPKEPKMAA